MMGEGELRQERECQEKGTGSDVSKRYKECII